MSVPTIILVALIGLFVGSLVNVVVVRLPREQQFGGWPRCTRCGHALAWWQVLPLVGWMAQGGRGRCCGQRLHWIFPLNELLIASAFTVFYMRYG